MQTQLKTIETPEYANFTWYKDPLTYGYKQTKKGSFRNDSSDRDIQKQTADRAKSKMINLIKGNINHYKEKPVFLTLTFSDNLTNLKTANNEFKKFVLRFNYYLGYNLSYVAIPEFQQRGAVHYHMLILNLPYTSGHQIETKIWKHGATDIRLVHREFGLFNYLTKYFSKSFKDFRFMHHKRFFYSLPNKLEVTRNEQMGIEKYNTIKVNSKLVNKFEYDIKDKVGNIINTITREEYLIT